MVGVFQMLENLLTSPPSKNKQIPQNNIFFILSLAWIRKALIKINRMN